MKYDTLSNEELLKIILRENNNDQAAAELINKFGDLKEILMKATAEELSEIKGLGPKKITQLQAIREISFRLYETPITPNYRISSPNDAFNLLKTTFMYEEIEKFRIILLNTKNVIISVELISVGTLSSSLCHPREIFNPAIKKRASSMILCHLHPSCLQSNEIPTPSNEDINLTNRLVEVGKIVGIPVIDHIIFGCHQFYSFKEEGLI